MRENKGRKTAYVSYVRVTDRLSYTHKEATELGEWLLEEGLSRYYGIKLDQEVRAKGPNGKPYLVDQPKIHYNISHSGDYVMCAISSVPVGVDIQEMKVTDIQKVGKKVLAEDEYRKFLKSEQMQEDFFRHWVMKESYLKWTGEGLTKDLKTLELKGWHQFLHVDRNYMCAIWSANPLEVRLKEEYMK